MNPIVKEMFEYFGSSKNDEEYLQHDGTPQRFAGDPTGSGRYREGSGKNPYQHGRDFLSRVEKLKASGWEETPENIKKEFGLTTTQYRIEKSISLDERKAQDIDRAKALKKDGLSTTEIGRRFGINESTVRGWFEQEEKKRYDQAKNTAEFLKKEIANKRMLDVGKNAELDIDLAQGLNISREKLDTALYLLQREGYHVYKARVPQPTNKNQTTTLKVLTAPDVEYKEIYEFDKIQTIKDYISRDDGKTFEKKFNYPESLSSKRLKIRYDEDGGSEKDGIVEIRRGVKDLDLGNSRYSQVRILVDGTHYIKGVAIYGDNMPDGIDVVFNTNKKRGTPMMSPNKDDKQVLKPIKKDPDNPFGSSVKDIDQGGQYWYDAKTGKRLEAKADSKYAKLGLINKTRDEGDWSEWKDNLPSQFLAKQSKSLIEKQLNLARTNKEAEYDDIMSLTNPTLKKYYLNKFASECDSAAVDLKAAALPGQKYHVIIPINSLKDDEIYAPKYKPGSKVALIRYPHGGTFEIPILTVTDKNPMAKKIIGPDSMDAVGITKKVADRLSGADFDGDTVMVIPTHDKKGKVKITSTKELPQLKDFNPKDYQYDEYDGKNYYRNGKKINIMKNTNTQMGIISNLITDMTIQGASNDEIARAVKHSMVVIDAEKHKLDYKKSYLDNGIQALQIKYQPKAWDENGNPIKGKGASTIFSRSKGQIQVLKRKGQPKINMKDKPWYDPARPEGSLIYNNADPKDLYYVLDTFDKKTGVRTLTTESGEKIKYNISSKKDIDKYAPIMNIDKKTGEVYFSNKDGTLKYRKKARTIDSTKMAETDDAMTLVSTFRHPKEIIYAEYANSLKTLGNKARKMMVNIGNLKMDPQAKKIYAKEISSLEAKINNAEKNDIRERTATRLAAVEISNYKKNMEDAKPEDIKKFSQRSMNKNRQIVGSVSRRNRNINITDREWEAIQAGAISENKLKKILNHTDPDSLRERAMPKNKKTLSNAQIARIKALNTSNFTINQIAEKMHISPSAVSNYLKGV